MLESAGLTDRAHMCACMWLSTCYAPVSCSHQTAWITLGQEGRTKALLLSFIIQTSATYHLCRAELQFHISCFRGIAFRENEREREKEAYTYWRFQVFFSKSSLGNKGVSCKEMYQGKRKKAFFFLQKRCLRFARLHRWEKSIHLLCFCWISLLSVYSTHGWWFCNKHRVSVKVKVCVQFNYTWQHKHCKAL